MIQKYYLKSNDEQYPYYNKIEWVKLLDSATIFNSLNEAKESFELEVARNSDKPNFRIYVYPVDKRYFEECCLNEAWVNKNKPNFNNCATCEDVYHKLIELFEIDDLGLSNDLLHDLAPKIVELIRK